MSGRLSASTEPAPPSRPEKRAEELVYGVTSLSPEDADAKRILELNRKHWTIENSCHNILDTAWQEDKSCIRKGHGPDNTSRLRRFAIGLIKARGLDVKPTTLRLNRKLRTVFDWLKMTANSQPRS